MPLAEFVEQPLIKGDGMFKKVTDICLARVRRQYCGLLPFITTSCRQKIITTVKDYNCLGERLCRDLTLC
ncbi:hypothetical protein MLD38_038924 [Melastoma candidum]|uniref:Uncharacterized protein n=1 Tax=Melastoma candidum TaxID=119954 RepID=A0ACB9L0G6_9MYRT|nr:hypothetical protein MLD38_038924 [Melastoma candidum]